MQKEHSLIVIFYIAAPRFGQSVHDSLVTFFQQTFDVLRSLCSGMNGRMDGQPQRSIVCEMKIAHTRHDVKTTVDRNRYDRKLQFVSQLERATAEQSHVAGEGASAFREDGERSTADQALARGCHRFGNGATTRLVYEYETGFFTRITHEGGVLRNEAFIIHLNSRPRKPERRKMSKAPWWLATKT